MKSVKDLVKLVFKAVTLAMGVAVVALSIMNKVDTSSAIVMLGIASACGGLALLTERGDK